MKYKPLAVQLARLALDHAISRDLEKGWYHCKSCGRMQVVPLPPAHLHNLQSHNTGCVYWDAWQLVRSQLKRIHT
jgi:hypothetical protein